MPIAFGDTPITSVSRGANAIASAALERLGFPGQTASVFSAISPPDAPTNVAITVEEDYAAPSQVTGLAVDSTGDGTIDLSWNAPASEAAISDYRVEYTPSGGSATEVLVGSNATSYQLTGLTNDTEYSVRVAAISAGGQGDYSAAVTGTPVSGPVALTFTQTASGCSPSWQVGNIPASATTIRLTLAGAFYENGYNIDGRVASFSLSADSMVRVTVTPRDLDIYYDGATNPGRFRTAVSDSKDHSFTATVDALDASDTVVGTIAGTSWEKPDCE